MDLRLLGPIELWVNARQVPLGPPKQRCVLAVLTLEANHVVPVETMTDRVWDHTPPDAARSLLQTYVARLRRVFASAGVDGGATLVYGSGGYQLAIDPELVDLHRFRRMLADSTAALPTGRDAAVDGLRQALELWRGTPLSGLDGAWAQRMRDVLLEQRLTAQHHLIDAQLEAGRTEELLGRLDELLAAHPLDEKLIGQQMLALHLAGRQAEALSRYREARARILDEMGDEPGPELRDLHQRLLRRDPTLRPPARQRRNGVVRPAQAADRPPKIVQRQLPAHTPHFVGRAGQLRELDSLAEASSEVDGTVRILNVIGPAGIGKTALAVHWAHQVAGRFPDGQLYVNLRGFDHTAAPMQPSEVIRGFLDAFDVPAERIPFSLDGQAGLYRSLLAGRRVLILLDNARDAEQVRPLLPGSPGCLVVITSHSVLASLVVGEGARPVVLDVLGDEEAAALLARHLGDDRTAAEPAAVAELIEHCARLPLALAITATRAATNPGFSLGALAAELRDEHTRLDALDAGDPSTSVRAVFSLSYEHLSPAAARTFRLLGLHRGPDVSLAATASLVGEPPHRVRDSLAELTRARLIGQPAPGRFAFHDLLRIFAADQAGAVETDDDRKAAVRRVLDHYLHSAVNAARLLDPAQAPITPTPPAAGVRPAEFRTYAQALAWCAAERQVLLVVIGHAVDGGFDGHAWQLAWALETFFQRRGHWHEWIATQNIALAAARRVGSRDGQARAHRSLGHGGILLGSQQVALYHLRRALQLSAEDDDQVGQAQARSTLAWVLERQGRHAEALDQANQALRLYRAAGHKIGQANSYNMVGWYHAQLGNHEEALAYCRQAVTLHGELDDRDGVASTLGSIGYAYQGLGQHRQAVAHYQRALELHRELGNRYYQAEVLAYLGDAHHAVGDAGAARDTWNQALAMFRELRHPSAEQVLAKLTAL